MTKTFKIIVLAAANGAGKGTFGKYISQIDQKFVHIDAGNIVRSEIKKQTKVGKKIQPIYESCKYLDESIDEIIWCELIKNKITQALEQNKTIIIDGCLRSNTTFNLLDKFIIINNLTADTLLVKLIASDATCVKRILARRVCPKCNVNYNLLLLSKNFNTCDKCKTKIEIRASDTQEFTKDRLLHFHEHIEPILEKAKKNYEFIAIDTECELEDLKKKYIQLFYIQNN